MYFSLWEDVLSYYNQYSHNDIARNYRWLSWQFGGSDRPCRTASQSVSEPEVWECLWEILPQNARVTCMVGQFWEFTLDNWSCVNDWNNLSKEIKPPTQKYPAVFSFGQAVYAFESWLLFVVKFKGMKNSREVDICANYDNFIPPHSHASFLIIFVHSKRYIYIYKDDMIYSQKLLTCQLGVSHNPKAQWTHPAEVTGPSFWSVPLINASSECHSCIAGQPCKCEVQRKGMERMKWYRVEHNIMQAYNHTDSRIFQVLILLLYILVFFDNLWHPISRKLSLAE